MGNRVQVLTKILMDLEEEGVTRLCTVPSRMLDYSAIPPKYWLPRKAGQRVTLCSAIENTERAYYGLTGEPHFKRRGRFIFILHDVAHEFVPVVPRILYIIE